MCESKRVALPNLRHLCSLSKEAGGIFANSRTERLLCLLNPVYYV